LSIHPKSIPATETLPGNADQLDALSDLQKDWDSFGSEPPTPEAISAARKLIDANRESILPHFVGPISGGGVQIEWRGPRGEIEVEVGPQGSSFSYLLIREKGTANRKAEEQHDISRSEILDMIRSVVP
jgi:hypothetical protein